MQNFDEINKLASRIKAIMLTLPSKIGTECVNFFKGSFRNQGWTDATFTPWAVRSPKAKRNKGRGILIDSGRLRNSIRISGMSSNSVTIGTDIPYSEMHNDGFDGTVNVKAHTRNIRSLQKIANVKEHTKHLRMPKRKFMGVSVTLNKNIKELIKINLIKLFN